MSERLKNDYLIVKPSKAEEKNSRILCGKNDYFIQANKKFYVSFIFLRKLLDHSHQNQGIKQEREGHGI